MVCVVATEVSGGTLSMCTVQQLVCVDAGSSRMIAYTQNNTYFSPNHGWYVWCISAIWQHNWQRLLNVCLVSRLTYPSICLAQLITFERFVV